MGVGDDEPATVGWRAADVPVAEATLGERADADDRYAVASGEQTRNASVTAGLVSVAARHAGLASAGLENVSVKSAGEVTEEETSSGSTDCAAETMVLLVQAGVAKSAKVNVAQGAANADAAMESVSAGDAAATTEDDLDVAKVTVSVLREEY